MSRRIKKIVKKDVSSKVSGLDRLQLNIMKSLNKTKSLFENIKLKREKKEKDLLFSDTNSSNGSDELRKLTDKLKNNENMFEKLSNQITIQTELFQQRLDRFQDIMRGLVIRDLPDLGPSPVQGDMSVEDIENFLDSLFENYGVMQEQYLQTKDESFLELAMDTQLAIQEINEIKGYLMERGRYDKEILNNFKKVI